MIELYCDGACSGNPGPGGWAFLIKADFLGLVDYYIESGYSGKQTTNNRMEIQACIEGLGEVYAQQAKYNKLGEDDILVITDSQYVINTMTKGWARNKNKELWDELDSTINVLESTGSKISWKWVKGHASNPYNKVCDEMAVKAYKQQCGFVPKQGAKDGSEITLTFKHIQQFTQKGNYIDVYEYLTKDNRKFYLSTVNCYELTSISDSHREVIDKAIRFVEDHYGS